METGLIWLFLFLALAIGWVLGLLSKSKSEASVLKYEAPKEFKHRLQLLFDSYNDESLDQFIQSLEVSPETVAIHISIGKHFRTQGEVEKAILIHQNLMAHPELSEQASAPVIYELSKDYKVAGLFDRAESLLKQLSGIREYQLKSRKLLLEIYEQEKEWQNAIDTGLQMELRKHPELSLKVAYYCCELAQEQLSTNDVLAARQQLKKALSVNKYCIKAYMMLAELDMGQGDYRQAIVQLKRVAEYSPENISLILPLLLSCTQATDSYERYRDYLQLLLHETGQVNILLAIVESLRCEGRDAEALTYLKDRTVNAPSLTALYELLSHREPDDELSLDVISVITRVIEKMSQERVAYQCGQCGFSGSSLHWQCPSCKTWQSVKPCVEYESDFGSATQSPRVDHP